MKQFFILFLISVSFLQVHAKVWRINNTPGVTADFTDCVAALASSSVVNDDTLYIEGSSTAYPGFNLTKRLVIIGTGYFITGTDSNPGLQIGNSSNFNAAVIVFDSTGSGSTLIGLDNFYFGAGTTGSSTDNITITRCRIAYLGNYYGYGPNTTMAGWKINKCHINNIEFNTFVVANWEVTNNIILSTLTINTAPSINNLIRNNVIRGAISLYSAYFSNNLITGTTLTTVNVTVKNNISSGANLPAGNGNLNNQLDAVVFQGLSGNTTDGQWRLKVSSSPAIGAGETISSITPDCGPFGTADPYKLSGIPAIPTIYSLTVPASVPSNATTMPITISTRSNN